MKPTISIIAAMDEKRGIGRDNKLPWHIPGDLPRFKELTMGHPVIMGRKTFESILGYLKKPLPGRTNIVITRDQSYSHEGVVIVHSLEEAIEKAQVENTNEVFIIGGAQIFNQCLARTDKLYLTLVKGDYQCDTFFPDYSEFNQETFHEEHPESTPPFVWTDLERI